MGTGPKERRLHANVKLSSIHRVAGPGEFDAAIVARAIKRRIRAIRACYERELRRKPTLAGTVEVTFTIKPRGNVVDVSSARNTINDEAVVTCVAKTIRRFRFNPGPTDGSVTFNMSFVMAPQG